MQAPHTASPRKWRSLVPSHPLFHLDGERLWEAFRHAHTNAHTLSLYLARVQEQPSQDRNRNSLILEHWRLQTFLGQRAAMSIFTSPNDMIQMVRGRVMVVACYAAFIQRAVISLSLSQLFSYCLISVWINRVKMWFSSVAQDDWRRNPHPSFLSHLLHHCARSPSLLHLSSFAVSCHHSHIWRLPLHLLPAGTCHRSQSHLSFSFPPSSRSSTHPQSFRHHPFFLVIPSPCAAPPLMLPDPLPIPPHDVPSLPPPSSSFVLHLHLLLTLSRSLFYSLGHFLPLLRVTPHELFTCALRGGGGFRCVSLQFTRRRAMFSER